MLREEDHAPELSEILKTGYLMMLGTPQNIRVAMYHDLSATMQGRIGVSTPIEDAEAYALGAGIFLAQYTVLRIILDGERSDPNDTFLKALDAATEIDPSRMEERLLEIQSRPVHHGHSNTEESASYLWDSATSFIIMAGRAFWKSKVDAHSAEVN